jgi:aminoglycoside phosphotransferase (APT) family kinase protein
MALRQTTRERAPGVARYLGHTPIGKNGSEPSCSAPASPQGVASALARYFARRFRCPRLEFEQAPLELHGGWETYTFAFQLQGRGPLPAAYRGPLILRLYSCGDGLGRARAEFAAQRHLAALDYLVVGNLFLEEDCSYFGGPFLVSPRLDSQPLLRSIVSKPWLVGAFAGHMAEAHAHLHRLPTRGFPRPRGAFLSRQLRELARVVHRHHLTRLRPGLEWLRTHRPASPRRPSILHLDFHPLNLLDAGDDRLVVIDWTEADVGDRHADVAQTLMTLDCMSDDSPGWFDRLCVGVGRLLFSTAYLSAYRKLLEVDDELLSYYCAFAALRRLCHYGKWLSVGPTMDGRKPCAIAHLQPDHFHVLERYFQKWSQVAVAL